MEVLSTASLWWIPVSHKTELVGANKLPPKHLITSVHGLIFSDNAILMTNLKKRGWDIPGGHVEKNEDVEDALHREIREETGAIVTNIRTLAYRKIELLEKPVENKYPYPISFQEFYLGYVVNLSTFVPTEEAIERKLFSFHDALSLKWVQDNLELYEYAIKQLRHE